MTCIAGLVSDGKVFIGGDSAGVSGWDLTIRADSKVFRNDEFLMGFTTSFRMGQILRYSFAPPAQPPETDLGKYMTTIFVDSIRASLKAGGFAKRDNEQESGGDFLVGYRGHIFMIGSDYQVAEPMDGFTAVGCGEAVARGSLFSTLGRPAEERVLIALQAAERMNAGVRGPFLVLSI